jgi:4-alpha-glucanotransferase
VLERAAAADPGFRAPPDWVRQLLLAADDFLFTRPLPDGTRGRSVIAGYPWFGDWGRDTMIALPGLTLCTGRRQSARRILETFARYLDAGMVPNLFPGSGERPEYNSVDAALWYVEAWRACLAAGGAPASEATWQALRGIAEAYAAGTRYGIAMDPADGLLHAGAPGVQLTWMDAKVGDWVVTPRGGKPVEVNALWYNALRTLADLAAARGDPDEARYGEWAARVRRGFARYLRADGRGLLDVLDGPQGDDARLRPNQILAVSLPHSPLEPAAQRGVVEACARHLAVSCGLRSLAPGEPGYQGRYQGDVTARDAAYHQGTAWTWLLGPFASAHLRVHGDPEAALRWLEPLGDHLLDGGLGTLGEICDGDPPHQPRGAPSQAWSVACVLEAWSRIQAHRRG